MGKAGFSGKQQKVTTSSVEDIPEALRESTNAKTRKNRSKKIVLLLGGLGGLGTLAAITYLWYFASVPQINSEAKRSPTISSSPAPAKSPSIANSPASQPDIILGQAGHFAYSEAPQDDLRPILADGRIMLRQAAAKHFLAMVAAARVAGVILVPISGFRSVKDQQNIFFSIKDQRRQTVSQRAEVSAPPGYSEHHTGYAVDIGDWLVPATNLNPNFDKTPAFKWLSANAARFNFEMSFPKHNSQGLSYEPWHWRFVGDRDSLETFYKAKNLKALNPSQ
ncbi:MAG: D-alanyl-D-alanine carboxypeptidase family protein [Chroococcidiopsidaceae cyanobacterium CP_BM_RX_35]|nr:D-alanyl-D-alanine carboxypeptidase family protein [Chroococcidiopsidaceae cyanobacterium CP_BM_RX_35]